MTKSKQNRTKSRANGKRGKVQNQARQSQSPVKIKKASKNSLNDFFCYQCTCKFCGNGAHVGYNCPAQVPSVQTLPSFPQQYPCCEDSGVTHEPYQCQPKNHDYYNEQDSYFDSNSFGFDQSQPQQYTANHPIFNAHNDYLDSEIQLNKEKQIEEERAAKAQNWKLPVCYDDDEERSDSLDDSIISGLPPFSAITPNEPVLSTEEPDNSLSMGDEHLDTIPATKSDEVIKSSVEDLIPIPSESEGIPEHMCDMLSHDNSPPLDASPPDYELVSSEVMEIVIPKVGGIEASNDNPIPFYDPIISGTHLNLTPSEESDFFLEETNNFDNSLPEFTTFSNVLFDVEYKSDSSDDQSCSDEDVLEKIILKPLSEEEIIPMKSLRTHDSSLSISSKIDSLLDEFAGELTLLKSIPPRIDETDCDFEEDIQFVSANSDAESESFSPSPILVKDSDSLMEEIDLFCTSDYPMPPGIVDKDYDSERDILIPKDLPSNNTLHLLKKSHFILIFLHFLFLLQNHQMEKSPDLLSHRGLKAFPPFAECPMMIHRQNNPPLDVLLFYFYPP
nr:hypothetical protein [Tanacetum cinerariifolium]